ncbi:hypothetical protein GCM10012278_03080 [Nonomuraea glycinis]|uniref:Uncharacterized protein n=1 Tax=Nonomuraea glycinis TaxID=2047744 RepID=A0A918A0H9_9ACTN|nr:hypothetical protein GCM10012278_03080 [Nonomuraea glycinis]
MRRIRTRASATHQPSRQRTPEEERYVGLGRLAWALREVGLRTSLVLPKGCEPFVLIERASGALRVRVTVRDGRWIFTWGHGRQQWADLSDSGFRRIWEAAQ